MVLIQAAPEAAKSAERMEGASMAVGDMRWVSIEYVRIGKVSGVEVLDEVRVHSTPVEEVRFMFGTECSTLEACA